MLQKVETLQEAQTLWKQFSPNERIWDVWEIMCAFHDEKRYTISFFTKDNGLIPLVQDTNDNSYELFGGCYPDNRVLWIQPEDFKEFFEELPSNTALFDINGVCVQKILQKFPEFQENFKDKDERYFLIPEEFNSDFMEHVDAKFSPDKRKHLLGELRKIRELNPRIELGEKGDVDTFIKLCNKNFGEESDYKTEEGQQEVRRVVQKLEELGYLRTVTIYINDQKEAIALCVLYNDVLTVMYSSSNNDIKNLGKLLNVETIQHGCKLKVKEIDYMMGTVWKPAWKMNSEPCFTFRK